MNTQIKTNSEWLASRKTLDEYLQCGDLVNDDIVNYFIEVLPPKTWTDRIIQMGEPAGNNALGHFTYATIIKYPNGINRYIGNVSVEDAKLF